MIDIVNIIRNIVEAVVVDETISPPTTLKFYTGEKAYQNLMADDQVFPAVYLDMPISSMVDIRQSGLMEEAFNLRLYFLDKNKLAATENEIRLVISEMRSYARKFLIACQAADDNIRTIDRVEFTELQNIFDVNVSGIEVFIVLTPFDFGSVC